MAEKGFLIFLKKNAANMLTAVRFTGGVLLIVLYLAKVIEPLSAPYYIIYTIAGLTDFFDGFVARKTGSTSKFGARLDSASDLLFYAVMVITLMPILLEKLALYVWIIIIGVFLVRFAAYGISAIKFRKFASTHNYFNKITGVLVFLVPYFINIPVFVYYVFLICAVGLAGSVIDLISFIRRSSLPEDGTLEDAKENETAEEDM